MARKALTILSIVTFLVTGTQALAGESCLERFQARDKEALDAKMSNAGDGAASVGMTGFVGVATYATYVLGGIVAGPAVVLVITVAGTAYILKTRYDAISQINQQIAVELEPMLVYKQAKAFVDSGKTKLSDMPEDLANTVRGVVAWAKSEHKNFPENLQLAIPKVIVALMDNGRLCSANGHLFNAKELLEVLKDMEWAPTP